MAAVLAVTLISGFLFWGRSGGKADGGIVEITIDGEVYGAYPLTEAQEVNMVSSYGKNTVVIEAGEAYVREADCPDKICVGIGKISRDGETICCLPHRLILTIERRE